MNHETKEVILKVTDVVKTVVHFGFIPFVIYLDELVDAVVLYGMGEQEEFTGYQHDAKTSPWAFDEASGLEEQEKEAPSEDSARTIATNTNTTKAIANLSTADIEMFKQLIEAVGNVGIDPIYNYQHQNSDNIRWEESTIKSEGASATFTESDNVRSKSTSLSASSDDDEYAYVLLGSRNIMRPSIRPPLPPPPPLLPLDFESRIGMSLPRIRQRHGLFNDHFNRPAPKKYVPPVVRENYTPVVRIQKIPTIIPEFMEMYIPTGKAARAKRDAMIGPSVLKKRVDKSIDTPVSANDGAVPTATCTDTELEAPTELATSNSIEPETSTSSQINQETPTESSTGVREDTLTTVSPHTKQVNDEASTRARRTSRLMVAWASSPSIYTSNSKPLRTLKGPLSLSSTSITLTATTRTNRTTATVVVIANDPERIRQRRSASRSTVAAQVAGGRAPRELRYYQPPSGLEDCVSTVLVGEEFSTPKTTTDLGSSGERRPIRILDDFVIYNKNKSRSGYGFRFTDLENYFDHCCEIGVSGKARPALIKHGRIFGRKKVQTTGTRTNSKGSLIHLSTVLNWGTEMVDNGESYLWVKTQFATYILGSPAYMYGPVYDDLFKRTRLTNLLMVALITDRDVTLEMFVSNMSYTMEGAYNRSPRRVLAGGPVRPGWDRPLSSSDLKAHSAYIQDEILLWWKQFNLPWEENPTPPIFKELDDLIKAQAILDPVAKCQMPPLRKKRVQEET
ncbi:hypothetical protein BGZ96_000688 [Linnemannia gamsii]|uniref:RFTS domain-containing protein n=1 Tax=Linnemannia gamsii TaxID=64522 RepID=A0ABQ7KGR8_9FUNG|nr:hypothetical protein BGZ96_000688 [Linnemannia gamsii]